VELPPSAFCRGVPHGLHVRRCDLQFLVANIQGTEKRFGLTQPEFGRGGVWTVTIDSNLIAKAEGIDIRVVCEGTLTGIGRLRHVVVIERLDQLLASRLAQLEESSSHCDAEDVEIIHLPMVSPPEVGADLSGQIPGASTLVTPRATQFGRTTDVLQRYPVSTTRAFDDETLLGPWRRSPDPVSARSGLVTTIGDEIGKHRASDPARPVRYCHYPPAGSAGNEDRHIGSVVNRTFIEMAKKVPEHEPAMGTTWLALPGNPPTSAARLQVFDASVERS
jgi:hypothetical protein